jgi:hypothetical protein
MPLGTFIAGRYSGTFDGVDTGITDEGYELQQSVSKEMIDESDAYGQSAIDGIYRGGNCFLQFVGKEYKAGAITPFWPYGALGVMATTAAPISRLDSNVAKAMVLSSTANTPAAAAPASLTASLAILAENADGRLLYNSKLRKVPVRLRCYPSLSSGTVTWFTQT